MAISPATASDAGNGRSLDIVRRVGVLDAALGALDEVENAVETNGRTPDGSKVNCAHSRSSKEQNGHKRRRTRPMPVLPPGPQRHPGTQVTELTVKNLVLRQ